MFRTLIPILRSAPMRMVGKHLLSGAANAMNDFNADPSNFRGVMKRNGIATLNNIGNDVVSRMRGNGFVARKRKRKTKSSTSTPKKKIKRARSKKKKPVNRSHPKRSYKKKKKSSSVNLDFLN